MRWKAYVFLTGEKSTTDNNKYGLPSSKSAPPIVEMKAFEDVIQMISNVKFRKVQDPFLNKIDKDLKSVNSSKKVIFSEFFKN